MSQDEQNFIVSREDWTLHRKGYQDQRRHKEKIKESIKSHLPDIISEENIIMSEGKDTVKIPIRSLDEYKIRYNYDNQQYVGSGDGDSQVGDVIAKEGSSHEFGPGREAGHATGEDYFEAEVSLAELEDVLFEELELPHFIQKEQKEMETEDIEFNDLRKRGLMGNLDKKRTILSALKRHSKSGKSAIYPILNEDLRFKTWDEVVQPESSAVIIAMMDTSGSMGKIRNTWRVASFFG